MAMGAMASRSAGTCAVDRDFLVLGSILAIPLGYGAVVVLSARPTVAQMIAVAGMTPLGIALSVLAIGLFQRAAFARDGLAVPREREVALLVSGLAAVLTITGFGIFKQTILPVRGFPFDPLLARMGRIMLGGTTPWEVTHALFGSLWPTIVIDRLYSFWILPVGTLPMLAAALAPTKRRRTQLVLAWMLAWILIATLGAWLLGSAGPCFYPSLVGADQNFATLGQRLARLADEAAARGSSLDAVRYQRMLLDAYQSRTLIAAGGISAMPSMHVAFATLLVLAARTMVPVLHYPAMLYLAVIWIGSVHLGWHYAVDGPVAVLAMLAVWRLSGWLARQAYPDAEGRAVPMSWPLARAARPRAAPSLA